MTMPIKNAGHIAGWRLCTGCGACYYACPDKRITLCDVPGDGIRPDVRPDGCGECAVCVDVCPGYAMTHPSGGNGGGRMEGLRQGWGPVLELWEGYAADPLIRFQGSSGGLVSALALYCLEKEGMHGVLHVGPDAGSPLKNKTVLSRDRREILGRTGSRYSPASPCDGLAQIENAPGRCVFIGKPCDVAAVRKAARLRPALGRNLGISLGIFCAGTPATQGTLDLLAGLNVDPDAVQDISYRGRGWPGKFSVRVKGEERPRELLTYMDSWGFVQKYRPYRCYLCPDGTSEFADISCGDAWHRHITDNEEGHSLILVRTEKGRRILRAAMDAGAVTLTPASPSLLEASQKNLLAKRGAIWGRLVALRAFGIPTPRLEGFSLFDNWMKLPFPEKIRSIGGTVRRILQRRYYKPAARAGGDER